MITSDKVKIGSELQAAIAASESRDDIPQPHGGQLVAAYERGHLGDMSTCMHAMAYLLQRIDELKERNA